ncbi:hypothetical protein PPGU19_080360 (plasmid) [Paraburkholderia sp. PGU19]|nr:hypothetical protein PPGU19_080360 [Paraburkholderia sp. PGU19]
MAANGRSFGGVEHRAWRYGDANQKLAMVAFALYGNIKHASRVRISCRYVIEYAASRVVQKTAIKRFSMLHDSSRNSTTAFPHCKRFYMPTAREIEGVALCLMQKE